MKAALALAILAVIAVVSDSSTITQFFKEPSINEPSINEPSINDLSDNDIAVNYHTIIEPSIDDLSIDDLSTDDLSASDRSSRYNLNVGNIGTGDRLLSRVNVVRRPIANAIQSEERRYSGSTNTRITAIQAFEMGATQFGSPRIVSGGLGRNSVIVRFTSAVGRGYNYQLSIWGR